ncbi:transcription factor castor [Bactrocera neohumeralis]|uniref:transcription factor castor n=1 Tax=Bactrocera neohumeralis TaxID=98809 RepID=UPI0021662544|nr:transcription factor castor [Bactrocera neohumeralis]
MSTQLEFIMQLYMMNLLQQQQQQQQQLQQQQQQQQQMHNLPSPSKREMEMDISSSTMTTATTFVDATQQTQQQQQHQQQQQQQPHNPRTHSRKNSQTTTTTITNCSSSSSCTTRSPNSNSNSSIAIQQQQLHNTQHNKLSPLQQLLFGQLSAPPPSMLATTPPALTAPSNLLLTPTTPNSGMSAAAALSLAAAAYNVSAASQFPVQTHIFPTNDLACDVGHITAANSLQSSTVTSTPTEDEERVEEGAEVAAASTQLDEEDCSPLDNASTTSNDVEDVSDTVTVEEEKYRAQAQDLSDRRTDRWHECRQADAEECGIKAQQQHQSDDVVEAVEVLDDDEEDEKPLASLRHSSAETRCLRTRSNVDARNSSNSLDGSTSVPYLTPTKQPADSTHYLSQQSTTELAQDVAGPFTQLTENESANMTPMSLAKTLLTPPSSDQLPTAIHKKHSLHPSTQTHNTELIQQAVGVAGLTGASGIMSLNTVSSLDAFLQNEENLKNLRKVSSYLECENVLCRQENLREHFHCFDEPCQGKILSKKDDIIRHLKWHKKRKESLLLGFARFSASDDCEPAYGAGCTYCWKQTHYHCVYEDCPKVYVSTSDVQMHANFHRKNSEIVQEGFRRFRAHENCKIEDCPFYGKKTSHYHCCREGCNHTFKNKADMDKHKSYHLRDYQLTQDGFKKILKTEACPFDGCKFSTVCNHIHCVREGCTYILHSSSQMISHKRKHERLDGEQAYQNFKKQKDSSGEDSPASIATTTAAASTVVATNVTTHTTTPLSSLSADRFLARKRGRPPKKIELPAKTESAKRIKLEPTTDQVAGTADATAQLANSAQMPSAAASLFPPPFLPNFNAATAAAAAAAAAQSMQMQDPNTPNMQLTHLMALFQLQNPLFYQNLYPGGMPANMASMLGAAAVAGVMPPATGLYGNMSTFGGSAGATIKSEYGEKQQQYKE